MPKRIGHSHRRGTHTLEAQPRSTPARILIALAGVVMAVAVAYLAVRAMAHTVLEAMAR